MAHLTVVRQNCTSAPPSEEWRTVLGAPHYEISSLGKVRSWLMRGWQGKGKLRLTPLLLKQSLKKQGKGYLTVILVTPTGRKDFRVNRLVADAFISNPDNKPEVNHKDGNKTNNVYTNLEWTTRLENDQHAIATGLRRLPQPLKSTAALAEEIYAKYYCSCVAALGRKPRHGCTHGNTTKALAVEYGRSSSGIEWLIKHRRAA